VKLFAAEDILLGVEALNEAIAAGMPLDRYSTIVKIFQKAGVISSRAQPTPPNKKEQEDGPQPREIPAAPHGNAEGGAHPGP
jgi:hypothetical protein